MVDSEHYRGERYVGVHHEGKRHAPARPTADEPGHTHRHCRTQCEPQCPASEVAVSDTRNRQSDRRGDSVQPAADSDENSGDVEGSLVSRVRNVPSVVDWKCPPLAKTVHCFEQLS